MIDTPTHFQNYFCDTETVSFDTPTHLAKAKIYFLNSIKQNPPSNGLCPWGRLD